MGTISKRMEMEEAKLGIQKMSSVKVPDQPYQVKKAMLWKRSGVILTDIANDHSADENTTVLEMLRELNALAAKPYTIMENKRVWYSREKGLLLPSFEKLTDEELEKLRPNPTNDCFFNIMYTGVIFDDIIFNSSLTRSEANTIFIQKDYAPYLIKSNTFRFENGKTWATRIFGQDSYGRKEQWLLATDGSMRNIAPLTSSNMMGFNNVPRYALYVPVHRLSRRTDCFCQSPGEAAFEWLSNGLIPQGLSEKNKKKYEEIMIQFDKLECDFNITDEGRLVFNNPRFDDSQKHKMSKPKAENNDNPLNLLQQNLLNCDYFRANIQPYDISTLTGINNGHWELAEPFDDSANGVEVDIPDTVSFFARPPQLDVIDDATCAIDFGTKSTIVVRRKDNMEKLMRIGMRSNSYNTEAQVSDYENPTVIQFNDLNSFVKAYQNRIGRPFTQWNQVTVSHQAADTLSNLNETGDSRQINAVFGELKQWANDKENYLNLRDAQGKLFTLKPYMELEDDDLDPIEFYAYYLGLYINNMYQKICLRYLLSYPVTYSMEVREHIRSSFERGLKKSLPPLILHDQDCMKRFSVKLGANEAVAYALSALKTYNLEPKEKGESISYAVFDFGGGTTDYDFGIETFKGGRQRFEVTEYGSGGNPYLGGENLLHLMAYEVYCENIDKMRENDIPFILPEKTKQIAGTEMLLKNAGDASLEARMNTRILVELLRPYWERNNGTNVKDVDESKKPFFEKAPQVTLFASGEADSDGKAISLEIDENALDDCLKCRIQEGVDNFFAKLKTSFTNKSAKLPIHIFLAGNSCKSPLLQEIMQDTLSQIEPKFEQKLQNVNEEIEDTRNCFILHKPMDVDADNTDIQIDECRTGKTGVAFGLLRTRPEAHDVQIRSKEEEADFRFFLGVELDGMLDVRGSNEKYGEWFFFTYADTEVFDIIYTEEAKACDGNMPIKGMKSIPIYLNENEIQGDDTADDVTIHMCKKGPETVVWAIGRDEDFQDGGNHGEEHEVQLN